MIRNLKQITSEFKTLAKTNCVYYTLSTLVLSAFLVIIGIIANLQINAHFTGQHIQKVYNGKNFYSVIDSLYNPSEFSNFRKNHNNINRIGTFYNSLTTSSLFDFISAFCQPIPIKDFRGSEQFLYNSDQFIKAHSDIPLNIKCFQLNQSAFCFHNLAINNGLSFVWDDIDYSTGKIPIVLGSNYKDIYDIGDCLFGNFYSKDFKFEITGFLTPNTFVYYKGNPEFYLDDYILLPYPKRCELVDATNFKFESILYFAMINGDLATTATKKDLLDEIKQIANNTGFIEFSVIGLPKISLKYNEIISVISANQKLLYVSMSLILILILFIQYSTTQLIIVRRKNLYKTYWLIGYPFYKRVFIQDIIIPYLSAFVLANILLTLCFEKISLVAVFSITLFAMIIFVISYIFSIKSFVKAINEVM